MLISALSDIVLFKKKKKKKKKMHKIPENREITIAENHRIWPLEHENLPLYMK